MPERNVRLKLAIVASLKTSRRVARLARMDETRVSDIVCGRGAPVTDAEKTKLAAVLGRRVEEIFPAAIGVLSWFMTL